jgi:putative RNA 2'-phosphotransferase
MHRKELKRFAKVLDYVLSVRPDEFGLVPDPEGYVPIKELFQALREDGEWSHVGCGHMVELQHSLEGKCFEIHDDRIRSKAGPPEAELEIEDPPPPRLYCGIRRRAHPVVLRHGLKPFKGSWIVLARTREMALRIGKRRDPEPVILEVRAPEAARGGTAFYKMKGQLILAESIPAKYLDGPPLTMKEPPPAPKPSPARPVEMPGSFFLDFSSQKNGGAGKKRDRKSWKWQKGGRGQKRRK